MVDGEAAAPGCEDASRRSVRETYELIGPHFARTRPEPWPAVERFLEGRRGEVGLDVGTGNGRHAAVLASCCERVLALDLSRSILRVAADRAGERGFAVDLLEADAVSLPIRPDRVHLGLYVAAIHHLHSRALRRTSLDELARVLVPGGLALVSAWSVSHSRFDREAGFDTTVDWTLPNGRGVERFYHIYDLDEFRRDIDASALARVESFQESGNCYAIVRPDA